MTILNRLRGAFGNVVPASDRTTPGRIYISGTGRAGTTFLVQLPTELGLDTGYRSQDRSKDYFEVARAGLEWDPADPAGPRVRKSPYLCDSLDELAGSGLRIDHIIIPVRDIGDAARSRIKVQVATTGTEDGQEVAGGLWSTSQASEQETVLRAKLSRLIEAAVKHDPGMIFLAFPRLVLDAEYTFAKLAPVLEGIPWTRFRTAFQAVSRPELVSRFE